MARIGFDGLMISPAGKGHARTELHAVEALAARGEHDLVVFVRAEGGAELLRGLDVRVVPVRERLTLQWELVGMPRAARRQRLDAMLTLTERLPLRGGPPAVVWLFESPVHRIGASRAAGSAWQRASDLATSALWRRSLARAAHVAFGSAATEREVLAEVPSLAGRTSVVHPGVPPGFSPGPARDRGRYVLHLGSSDPRDNTQAAVEAARVADVRLLVAGGGARVDGDAPHVELLGRVSEEELVDLYRGAAAFVDPTLYEGFGYGVLEAMACGAPVVASSLTSIPEVVGDAGLLCDPREPGALAAALRSVLADDVLAAELRRRGPERARTFRWDRTAAGLAEALVSAVRPPRGRAAA